MEVLIPKIKRRAKRGFTIVEMMVSMTVFMVAIAISSNFFVAAIRTQSKALADQQVISQTSYALDYMSRSLRMARKDIDGDCITTPKVNYEKTPTGVRFEDHKGDCREFFLENGQIKQYLDGEVLPLTSNNLSVEEFNINLEGETQGSSDNLDHFQPRVTLFLSVKEITQKEVKEFQTTISQRNLDIFK